MKPRKLLILASVVALFGILNCVLIEPALTYKDEVPHSESNEDSDCCFIHCSLHHQCIPSQSSALTHPVLLSGGLVSASIAFHLDSPVGTIFHPPLAF